MADFTIVSRPVAIRFQCPFCESEEEIPWEEVKHPDYWGVTNGMILNAHPAAKWFLWGNGFMTEYIEREAAYREICADDTMSGYEKAYCSELIRNIPAANVAPTVDAMAQGKMTKFELCEKAIDFAMSALCDGFLDMPSGCGGCPLYDPDDLDDDGNANCRESMLRQFVDKYESEFLDMD